MNKKHKQHINYKSGNIKYHKQRNKKYKKHIKK